MSSLSIDMVKYCFAFLLLELNPFKFALANWSQLSRLSPIQNSNRVLEVKSKPKYCDMKVKVLDDMPKTSR